MSEQMKRFLLVGAALAAGAFLTIQAATAPSTVYAHGNGPPPTKPAAPDTLR